MNVLDLFSGIGGMSLGLERAGMQTVAFCEIEPFPRRVLAKHWPNVPIHGDVRKLRGEDVGPVDVICGGYPCQPFSTAGKRGGKEDDRHLWPEFSRLVAELRPSWVIGENVAGHISMGLDDVLSDLEGQGYACRTFVIPACAVGLQHRRDRCWIVAYADSPERRQERGSCDRLAQQENSIQRQGEEGAGGPSGSGENVADTECDGLQGVGSLGVSKGAGRSPQGQATAGSVGRGDRSGSWEIAQSRLGRGSNGFSSWMDGGLDGQDCKAIADEALQCVWRDDAAEAVQRALGGFGAVSTQEILLAFLCEYAIRKNTGRLAMDRAEARRQCMRGLWRHIEAARSPLRPRHNEQHAREFTDALRKLSRNAPSLSPAAGLAGFWEDGLDRVKAGVPDRAARLKALGNAVVPQIPEMIGRAIMEAEAV